MARLLVPDNLRTGVAKADRYEPALNPSYARMAEHYGTAVIPARVKRPRDKPVVEGSVRFVANQVAAVLRNRRFVGLAELNEAIVEQVGEINDRPFQKREDSRHIVFVRDEKPLLIPLPRIGFELADLRKPRREPTITFRSIRTSTRSRQVDRHVIGRAHHLPHRGGLRRHRAGGFSSAVQGSAWPVQHCDRAYARSAPRSAR